MEDVDIPLLGEATAGGEQDIAAIRQTSGEVGGVTT